MVEAAKVAVNSMTKLGGIDVKSLPKFIRPLYNVIIKVITVITDVTTDVRAFYNVRITLANFLETWTQNWSNIYKCFIVG